MTEFKEEVKWRGRVRWQVSTNGCCKTRSEARSKERFSPGELGHRDQRLDPELA